MVEKKAQPPSRKGMQFAILVVAPATGDDKTWLESQRKEFENYLHPPLPFRALPSPATLFSERYLSIRRSETRLRRRDVFGGGTEMRVVSKKRVSSSADRARTQETSRVVSPRAAATSATSILALFYVVVCRGSSEI